MVLRCRSTSPEVQPPVLIAEADWIGSITGRLPDDAFPLGNIGCQTEQFRQETQPWIDQRVFAPLRARDRPVVHVDIRDEPGVDVVADLMSDAGMASIRGLGIRTILCSNLLEHVEDPVVVLDRLVEAVPPGGYLIVTGPQNFPYHADPIDTMFRPTWEEMAALIGDRLELQDGTNLQCRRLGYYYSRGRFGRARLAARLAAFFYRPAVWRERIHWVARRSTQYCLFLQRPLADGGIQR